LSITLNEIETIVVKVGTSLLGDEHGFDGRVVEGVVRDLAALKHDLNLNILIVSSGAMGCGMHALNLKERPKEVRLKQATAAVGQSRLVHYYETLFQTYGDGLHAAQVLITLAELDERQNYLNIRNTIKTLFDLGVVPIVNENDSVATDELRLGDNDTLAARVAAGIDADLLIILSNVDGLYDKNPAKHEDAKLLEIVDQVTDVIENLAEDTITETTIGGMVTKLHAAKIAGAAGLPTVIANGNRPNVIRDIFAYDCPMTLFSPAPQALSHRKRWIAFGRAARGKVTVDQGACQALTIKGKSLLAAGITEVSGPFELGAAVRISDSTGKEIACGLVNYSSTDLDRIKGCKSTEIKAILGYKVYDEVIHRDNLALL
jgi:glutamate 5-kinase